MLGSGKLQASLDTFEQKDVGLQESRSSQLSVVGLIVFVPGGLGDGVGVGVGGLGVGVGAGGLGVGVGVGLGVGLGVAPQASVMS